MIIKKIYIYIFYSPQYNTFAIAREIPRLLHNCINLITNMPQSVLQIVIKEIISQLGIKLVNL